MTPLSFIATVPVSAISDRHTPTDRHAAAAYSFRGLANCARNISMDAAQTTLADEWHQDRSGHGKTPRREARVASR